MREIVVKLIVEPGEKKYLNKSLKIFEFGFIP